MITTKPVYQNQIKDNGDGTFRALVQITDDAVTPPTFLEWITVSGASLPEISDSASREIDRRNKAYAQKALIATIPNNYQIPLTPSAAPAPTAQQTYLARIARMEALNRLKSDITTAGGVVPQALTDDIGAAVALLVGSNYVSAYFP